jgi:hypothetical protein
LDPIIRRGMRRKEASGTRTFGLHQPGQRGRHDPFAIVPGSLKELGTMAIGRVFRVSPVRSRDQQISGHRQQTGTWHTECAKQDSGNIRPGPNGLQFAYVPEIRMRNLMRENPRELFLIRPKKEPGRHIKFSATRIGGIDVGVIHQPDANLIQWDRVVHLLE